MGDELILSCRFRSRSFCQAFFLTLSYSRQLKIRQVRSWVLSFMKHCALCCYPIVVVCFLCFCCSAGATLNLTNRCRLKGFEYIRFQAPGEENIIGRQAAAQPNFTYSLISTLMVVVLYLYSQVLNRVKINYLLDIGYTTDFFLPVVFFQK